MKLNDLIAIAREFKLMGFFIVLGFAIYLSYQAGKQHIIDGLDEHFENGNGHGECYADAVMIDKEWNPKTKHWE
jgi:hypothetical protein